MHLSTAVWDGPQVGMTTPSALARSLRKEVGEPSEITYRALLRLTVQSWFQNRSRLRFSSRVLRLSCFCAATGPNGASNQTTNVSLPARQAPALTGSLILWAPSND